MVLLISDGVVDLVGTSVVQVFTLQIELTAVVLTHPFGKVEGRWTTYIVFQESMICFLELCRLDDGQISLLQIVYALVEYLWYVGTSEFSVKTSFIYKIVLFHFIMLFL